MAGTTRGSRVTGNVNVERSGRALSVPSMERTHLIGIVLHLKMTDCLDVNFFVFICSPQGGAGGGASEEQKLLLERKCW